MEDHEIKKIVRDRYGKVARTSSCCGSSSKDVKINEPSNNASCCTTNEIGYKIEELKNIPEGSDLGLGCGNPTASADLKNGETVLDLGSGAGVDCFLAANKVGDDGKVIGVDMTPNMIDRARENALKGDYNNVEFRLGEIENLPVADNQVDVIISNCVINLSPDKDKVFKEAFRVLKPNGRIVVSDIVLRKELPDYIKNNPDAIAGCVAGAILKEQYLQKIKNAGFRDVQVIEQSSYPESDIEDEDIEVIGERNFTLEDIKKILPTLQSIKVKAIK
ncbi:MAG: arsenite methyltransferase [Promethearchaeota archaeon]